MRLDYRDNPLESNLPFAKVTNLDTGEELQDCFLADDETGEWGCYVRLPDGSFSYDDDMMLFSGNLHLHEKYGKNHLKIELLP
jgi:hypothetical protein